jgi:hypothetical protein
MDGSYDFALSGEAITEKAVSRVLGALDCLVHVFPQTGLRGP